MSTAVVHDLKSLHIFKRPTHRGGIKGTRRKQNNISGNALHQTPGIIDTTIPDISTTTQDKHSTLCLLNAQSVCSKTDLLADYITEHDFDLVAITETWLKGNESDKRVIGNLVPDGYVIAHIPPCSMPRWWCCNYPQIRYHSQTFKSF